MYITVKVLYSFNVLYVTQNCWAQWKYLVPAFYSIPTSEIQNLSDIFITLLEQTVGDRLSMLNDHCYLIAQLAKMSGDVILQRHLEKWFMNSLLLRHAKSQRTNFKNIWLMFYIWPIQIMRKRNPSWTSSSDVLHINRVIFTDDKRMHDLQTWLH